jgi:WASH complex subunit strumpellin
LYWNINQVRESQQKTNHYLTEGVLTEESVLDGVEKLLNCIRRSNECVRWLMLHRRTKIKKIHDRIVVKGIPADEIIGLLMSTSQLEFKLSTLFTELLQTRDEKWSKHQKTSADNMSELSDYFSGDMPLSKKVAPNAGLKKYFADMSGSISQLDIKESTSAGRKIQGMQQALEEVESLYDNAVSMQVKEYLEDTKNRLMQMIRVVNIQDQTLAIIDVISDFSYAWETIGDYIPILHKGIRLQPTSVKQLRALFLKLASIMDVPLTRILESNSPDLESVAKHYSEELVGFVRRVLEVVPASVFKILSQIVEIQSKHIVPVPSKFEAQYLKKYYQVILLMFRAETVSYRCDISC